MRYIANYLEAANKHLKAEYKKHKQSDFDPKYSLFNKKGEIQGEYPPFAASFGAAILRSGLLPAVFLYAEKSGAGKDKTPLNNLMLAMLKSDSDAHKFEDSLLEYVLKSRTGENDIQLRRRVLDATVAAKLALRTYPVEGKTKTPPKPSESSVPS